MLSCNQVNLKKINVNEAIENELKQFSTTKVDVYPSFENCNNNEESWETELCFVETIHLHTANYFKKNTIPLDSLGIYLYITSKGKLNIHHIESKNNNSQIDSLKHGLNDYLQQNLPSLYPAQKQGIPVNCKLVLPIVIKNQTLDPNENL